MTLGEKENAEIEGKITGVSGNAVTVRTEKDRTLTLTADSTTTIRIRGTTGALADLKTGLKVNAKFDPFTKVATRIVVQTQEEESEDEEEGERKEAETPTNIPHTLQGRTDCLACHQTGAAGGPDVPADHSGRTSATCQGCHQPKRT
ncbi:MAG: hypothetical protein HW414_1408 [Dehalococcoidia bacterium]|nr:hypothetical protein [Dehalococcoidia bacterium]